MIDRSRRDKKGQVLVLFALFLVVMIGATAITVDFGSWLKVRRDYQNVVDAAVLAGGGFLSRPIDNTKRTQARRAAWESLNNQLGLGLTTTDLDGLDDSNTPAGSPMIVGGYRVWVSTPPIGSSTKYPGLFSGSNDRYLFAWVEKDNPSFFSHVFGQGDRTVSAWATSGVFAGQFAIITLRQNGQGPPSAPSDINLDGSGTVLRVVDGDVGGNWGMKLTSSANLYLQGDADAYLVDYVSCGNSCWSPNQVSDGAGTFKTALQLPNIVDDPNYPLPSLLTTLPASGGVPPGLPQASGTDNGPPATKIGDVTITKGTIMAAPGVSCAPNGPRIGPGWYHDINVSGCVVLDPVHNFSDPDDANGDGDYGMSDVPATQQPGIFYITGALNVNNNAMAVGDGVSLVIREQGNTPGLVVNGNGIVDINTGASDGVKGSPTRKKAAFQTDGSYSYTFDAGSNTWIYTADNNDKSTVGMTVYVVTPAQLGDNTPDANTSIIKVNSGAAISWQGILYAPRDNITLSGQPLHDAIGQFICWTVKLAGGTTVTQVYDGPGESAPRLVEPRIGE